MAAKLNDLTGRRFGRWTVIRRWGSKTYRYEDGSVVVPLWLCRCDCGGEGVVDGGNLKNGHSKSCGCLKKEQVSQRNIASSQPHGSDGKWRDANGKTN